MTRARVAAVALALGACVRPTGSGDTGIERHHPLVGARAPALALAAVDTAAPHTERTAGAVTLVDFWASWCDPCTASFPKLEDLYQRYRARGFDVVAVSEDDDRALAADFARIYGVTFPVLWDEKKRVAGRWMPRQLPAAFLVDRAGVVRFVHIGYHDGEEAEIEVELERLL